MVNESDGHQDGNVGTMVLRSNDVEDDKWS